MSIPCGTASKDRLIESRSKLHVLKIITRDITKLIAGSSQTQLVKENNPLAQQLLPNNNLAGSLFASSAPEHERLMDIPGFLWGFCCSFVGVFLVYLSIDDPEAKKKEGRQAIIGCAVGTVLWTGMYVLAIFYASNY